MRRRRNYQRPIIVSITNRVFDTIGLTGSVQNRIIAKAVTSPAPAVETDVSHGCLIQAIYISIDFCGLGGTGVLNNISAYLFKNPGANLTPPLPVSVGQSNEKKFVIKQWHAMAMRNQDGNNPYHWEGWIPIPKRYQRMGTDDVWQLVAAATSGLTGHFSSMVIYKWKR